MKRCLPSIGMVAVLLGAPLTGRSAPVIVEWISQLGSNNVDGSYSISADGLRNVYTSGLTSGDLNGTSAGVSTRL